MNRLFQFSSLIAAFVLVSVAPAQEEVKLKVGDPAPKLKIAKWAKGKALKSFDKGKVYVVEFWATWCGPCKDSIPHITELAKKFAGKATFTGVSVWENPPGKTGTEYIPKVEKFVKDMGNKMDYLVAIDGADNFMAKSWMEAAGQNGIPTAFVIGKDGKIAWIGHPMAGLDKVVELVVADKYDANAEASKAAKERAEMEAMAKLFEPFTKAMEADDHKTAIVELDKILAQKPELEIHMAETKFMLLIRVEEAKAYAYAKTVCEGVGKNDSALLNQLAWTIVDGKDPQTEESLGLKNPDYALAMAIAERAVEITKGADAFILDTLAFAQFKNKLVDKAIENQEKAVKIAKADGKVPPQILKDMEERLAMFKKAKGG